MSHLLSAVNGVLFVLSAPGRACRRFEQYCEQPGRMEAAIAFCDQLLPMIAVTAVSMLVGLLLASLIAYAFNH